MRTITTPTLNPNQRYHYTVKMEVVRNGRTLSQTQRVQLVPGATTQVEFNNASVVVAR